MNGAEQKWAYDQAVTDTNAAGGITMNGKKYKVELKYADDQSDRSRSPPPWSNSSRSTASS